MRERIPRRRPVRWRPPAKQRETPVAYPVTVVDLPGTGGEDALIQRSGTVVTGLANGDVVRVGNGGPKVLGNTGGRPLGIEEMADGTLLVCDHNRGLLRLDVGSGAVDVLLDTIEGKPLRFCSNAVICNDGTIYFTTSSETATWADYRDDVIDHAATGRLVRFGPDGAVTVLRRRLAFANGLALAPDESYVLVAETIGYRILKIWLTGPRAGEATTFVTGLPGFPDNLSLSETGLVWVALPAPRVPVLDLLLPGPPILRQALRRIPERLRPRPAKVIWVQAYDLSGRLVHNIKTRHKQLSFVTAVAERNGTVWLASAQHDVLAKITGTFNAEIDGLKS